MTQPWQKHCDLELREGDNCLVKDFCDTFRGKVQRYGYVYVRRNEYWDSKNIVKLGITTSPKNREYTYITSEHERGNYILVYKVPLDELTTIDNLLKREFKPYNNYINGGTEYYNPIIIDKIGPYLNYINIDYKSIDVSKMEQIQCEIQFELKIKHLVNNGIMRKFIQKALLKTKQRKVSRPIKMSHSKSENSEIVTKCSEQEKKFEEGIVKINRKSKKVLKSEEIHEKNKLDVLPTSTSKKKPNYDYADSKIKSVSLMALGVSYIPKKNHYKTIRDLIYKEIIKNADIIIEHTTGNITKEKRDNCGFTYIAELDIYVQCMSANGCMKEIIQQCEKNNISLDVQILLKTNETININR
jgi:hypothetical protein